MSLVQSDTRFHRALHAHPRKTDETAATVHPIKAIFAGIGLLILVELALYGIAALLAHSAGMGTREFISSDDPTDLRTNTYSLLSLAALIPVFFVAARVASYHGRFLWSVVGRIRWKLIGVGLAVSFIVEMAGQFIVNIGGEGLEFRHLEGKDFVLILVVLLLVPLQATAEELLSRGFLPQIVGKWFKSPWVAYAPGALLWVYLHSYGSWGLLSIGFSAILYAFLVHKTGGLETTIGIHTIGNYIAFLQPVFLISHDSGDVTWGSAVYDMLVTTVTVAVIYIILRRRLGSTSVPVQATTE